MTAQALTREAFHEAGHAVIARWLGLGLGRIWISASEGLGGADVHWPSAKDRQNELRILLAAKVCMNAFGIDTFNDPGAFGDDVEINNILDEEFPDDDDDSLARNDYLERVDREVAGLFKEPQIRAAALALAEILTRTSKIDGSEAEILLDGYLKG